MSDYDGLYKRLHGSANFLDKAGFTGFPLIAKDCRDAADAIERLEADNAALRQDAERLDWLDLQADDWTYKESKVWKIVGPKISIREAIDSVRPMRQDDDAMREGKP